MKILFVGPLWLGSNALSMANGLLAAGNQVTAVDTTPLNRLTKFTPDWAVHKLLGRRRPRTVREITGKIERLATQHTFDLLFCYKTIFLPQDTLLNLPIRNKIHYSADDVSNPDNVSPDYIRHESGWSRVVTTKQHNLQEISERGGNPLFVLSAYDPAWHYRQIARNAQWFDVGFVGNRRPDRDCLLRHLASKYRKRMVIAGEGWKSDQQLKRSDVLIDHAVYGAEYSRLISSIGVNLVLLNSDNRDTHTCRSFEVPASGGLFLGPRTTEHQQILEEGKEAFMYSTSEELEEVLDELMRRPELVSRVAEAGHRRVVTSKNTYADRARQILDALPN